MPRAFLFLFGLILLTFSLKAQNSLNGRVLDQNQKPLPFVNITINDGRLGTTTDLDGYFELSSRDIIQKLRFSYIGFETKEIAANELGSTPITVVLQEEQTALEEVVVTAKENPAHRIIDQAIINKKLNDPEALAEFSYKSYSKFWITVNVDSIDPTIDTITLRVPDSIAVDTDTLYKLDSSNYKMQRFFSKQHLFFMETVTERKYKNPRDNETVLAQRTSGFKNPMFALLVTQLQSFSVYGDYIGITSSEYLNPISRGATERYWFLLEDTIFNPAGDSLFTISFRPRPNKGFKALKGAVTIDSRDWAIVNFRASPAVEEALPVEIRQSSKRFGKNTWFPVMFEADIKLPNVEVNNSIPEAIMRRRLLDINLNPALEKKDISRAVLTIDESAGKKAEDVLERLRGDSLDTKEQKTYRVIDSLSQAENLERNLNILLTVTRGYIPWKFFNFDINKLIRYNTYEGFRLGLGGETNDRLSEYFRIGGYFAYGFRDETSKYGAHFELDLNKNRRFALRGGYQFDLFETGGFRAWTDENQSFFTNNTRRLFIEQWDKTERYFLGFTIDPLPGISYELMLNRESRKTVGNYGFNSAENSFVNEPFEYTEFINSLRIAPKEKFAETPFGKIKLEEGYPVFYLSYTRGLDNILEGDFDFHHLQARAVHKIRWLRIGTSHFEARGGLASADLPAQKLFVGTSNLITTDDFWRRSFAFADRGSFETMRFNEFLSNQYLELLFRHDLKSLLFARGDFRPHIELVSRAAIGTLSGEENHLYYNFKTLEHGFFESGIELNRLYVGSGIGTALGLGFYYRYGAYHLPEAIDNFTIKFTSKFIL